MAAAPHSRATNSVNKRREKLTISIALASHFRSARRPAESEKSPVTRHINHRFVEIEFPAVGAGRSWMFYGGDEAVASPTKVVNVRAPSIMGHSAVYCSSALG